MTMAIPPVNNDKVCINDPIIPSSRLEKQKNRISIIHSLEERNNTDDITYHDNCNTQENLVEHDVAEGIPRSESLSSVHIDEEEFGVNNICNFNESIEESVGSCSKDIEVDQSNVLKRTVHEDAETKIQYDKRLVDTATNGTNSKELMSVCLSENTKGQTKDQDVNPNITELANSKSELNQNNSEIYSLINKKIIDPSDDQNDDYLEAVADLNNSSNLELGPEAAKPIPKCSGQDLKNDEMHIAISSSRQDVQLPQISTCQEQDDTAIATEEAYGIYCDEDCLHSDSIGQGNDHQDCEVEHTSRTMNQICSAINDPMEEIKKTMTSFASNARAVVKEATNTNESYFQSWNIDSLRELLARHHVTVRGSSMAPHEYFVMICDEVFGDGYDLPHENDYIVLEDVKQMNNQYAQMIQNIFVSYRRQKAVKERRKNSLNISFEYEPSLSSIQSLNREVDDLLLRRRSSELNVMTSMYCTSIDVRRRPRSFAKLDDQDLDDELEVEWRKPSWRYAKRVEAENRPHKAGEGKEAYDWRNTTLGRHCLSGGCGEQLDLWDEGQISEFAQFGSGVTNYFKFLKWSAWMMFLLTILHIPVLFINMFGTTTQYDNVFTAAITTFGNLGSAEDVVEVQIPGCDESDFQEDMCSIRKDRLALFYSLIDTVGTLLVVLGFVWLQRFEASEASNLGRSTVKASDYTITVQNIPPHSTEAQIKAHFAKVTGEAISSVSLAFANSDEIRMYIRRGELMKKRFVCIHKIRYEKTMLKVYGEGASDQKHLNKMLKERTKLTKSIQEHDMERSRKVKSNPNAIQAFVTFSTEDGMIKAMTAYQMSWIRRFICFYPRRLRFKGKKLIVDKSPEPSTILWENLEYSSLNRTLRKCLTNTVAFLAILLSVAFTFLARDFQSSTLADNFVQCPDTFFDYDTQTQLSIIVDDKSLIRCYCTTMSMFEQGKDSVCLDHMKKSLQSMAMSYGAAATICFMNFFFTWLMEKAGSFEKHHSITAMETSIMIRVFLMKFVNTGCLVLLFNQRWLRSIINVDIDTNQADFDVLWYDTGGMSIVIVMFINILSPHISPYFQYKKFKANIKRIESNLTEDQNTSDAHGVWYTQDELNASYIGPQFRLNHRYAQILVNFYVCWMYSISMPIMPIIGAIIFYISYWMDKFLFCNFYRIPPMYTDELGKMSTKLVGYSVVVHLCMSIWMLGNREIFRSRSFRDDIATHASIDLSTGSHLEQLHLFPIEALLCAYLLGRIIIIIIQFSGSQSVNLLKCLTCRSGNQVKHLMKQKERKYIKVDFCRAVERGMIKGLASYNMLHNPKYQEAFAISEEFARNKTRLSHISGLNTKEGSLCLNKDENIEVTDQVMEEKLPSRDEQILFENL